jgi:hypothetical protein
MSITGYGKNQWRGRQGAQIFLTSGDRFGYFYPEALIMGKTTIL